METVVGVILAGGKSHRMGRDKAWLTVDGKPLLMRVFAVMQAAFPRVWIIVDHPGRELPSLLPDTDPEDTKKLRPEIIADLIPDAGPLGGIYTALHRMTHSSAPLTPGLSGAFVVACDMPFLSKEAIEALLRKAPLYDVVLPTVGGRRQPLHAYYGLSCLEPLGEKLRQRDLSLHTLWPGVRVYDMDETTYRRFDPELRSLVNVNTPEDLNPP